MADNFKAGIDPHSATARIMLGLPADAELTDEQRQVGKTGNFSIIYMGGVPTIVRQLGCSEPEAKKLLKKLKEGMPGVAALFDEIVSTYRSRGYIMTISGRHLTVDPAIVNKRGSKRAEGALLNYLIQGSAAELLRDALIKIHCWLYNEGLHSHMVNQVHDEIQVDGIWDELDQLVSCIPPLMGNAMVEEFVPIKADIEISDTTWADKHSLEENA